MKIAQYDIGAQVIIIRAAEDEKWSKYPRVSEYVDVTFVPRAANEVVPEQLEAIEKKMQTVNDQYVRAMDMLKAERANLLSLVYEAPTVEAAT